MSRLRVLFGVAAVGTMAAVTPAAAGLLDFLFGRPAPAPYYAPPAYQPLGVRVQARRTVRKAVRVKEARKPEIRKKVARSESGEPTRSALLQKPMSPVTQPDWFLRDPNLRNGDIVILDEGAMVFTGSRKTRTREDFVSLKDSSSVSRKGQREIDMMVSGVWTPPAPVLAVATRSRAGHRRISHAD